MAKKRQIIRDLFILAYFILVTCIISFPLILHMHEYIFGLGDELLLTWILNWNIHSFVTNPLAIYNANIYYPYPQTLTYSDAFFTASIISAIPVLFSKYPLLAYNFTYFFSHITLGFFTYLFVKKLTTSPSAGAISGTLASFTTYTISRHFHLQLLGIQWIPLSSLFFYRYTQEKKLRDFLLCALFFVLQTANSFLPGFFLLWCYGCWVVYLFFRDRSVLSSFITKKTLVVVIVSMSMIALLALPYFKTSYELRYVRNIRDTIRFANRPEYTLYPSDKTRLAPYLKELFYKNDKHPIKHDGYVGLALILLGSAAVIYRLILFTKSSWFYLDLFLFIAGSSFILSLGPFFQWGGKVIKEPFPIPLPYAVFYYLVPGFKGFRSSERWEMLFVFCLAVVSGLFLAHIFKALEKKWVIILTAFICLTVLLEVQRPYAYFSVPKNASIPKVYGYIAALPADTAIVELPMYNWNMTPHAQQENMRLYYSLFHFKNMMNGTSGFSPPPWERMVEYIYFHFPDRKTVAYFKQIGVTHVIIHKGEYDQLEKEDFTVMGKVTPTWSELQERIRQYPEISLVKVINQDYVYILKNE